MPALAVVQPQAADAPAAAPKPRIKATLAKASLSKTNQASRTLAKAPSPAQAKPLAAKLAAQPPGAGPQALLAPLRLPALPPLPPAQGPVEWQGPGPVVISPARMSQSLMDRYQQALENQQLVIKSLGGR